MSKCIHEVTGVLKWALQDACKNVNIEVKQQYRKPNGKQANHVWDLGILRTIARKQFNRTCGQQQHQIGVELNELKIPDQ